MGETLMQRRRVSEEVFRYVKLYPVSYTHLDVYKRQAWYGVKNSGGVRWTRV